MTQAPADITGPGRLPKPAWTLVLASLGLFMSALDNMVVTTAWYCAPNWRVRAGFFVPAGG